MNLKKKQIPKKNLFDVLKIVHIFILDFSIKKATYYDLNLLSLLQCKGNGIHAYRHYANDLNFQFEAM